MRIKISLARSSKSRRRGYILKKEVGSLAMAKPWCAMWYPFEVHLVTRDQLSMLEAKLVKVL